uniref:N6 adenine-specific DNA methyltransferase N-terminal domain-containing protein n=1 Tax=Geobacter sp. (strain M21) TaxID=443144 RepID=C6E122_GEOSM
MPQHNGKPLNITTQVNWLWDAACSIRGAVGALKQKDYIQPLIVIRRISDVGGEIAHLAEDFLDEEAAQGIAEADRKLIRFWVPCLLPYEWRAA